MLFEVWLEACGSPWFPPPPLWRTLREMAQTWRHRLPLVHHWNRVNLALTHRLIAFLLGPQFPIHHYSEWDPFKIYYFNNSDSDLYFLSLVSLDK